MDLAEQLEQDEKYEEAYAEYKKQLLRKCDDVELLTKLSHIALILEKSEEAKAYFGKILEVDPANIMAHEQLLDLYVHEDKFKYYLLRGNLRAIQQQMSHAKSDYLKAISSAKSIEESLPARYLYAGICEQQEKFTDAIDEYLKISDYDEKNPAIFLKLAQLYEQTEGISASIHILERGKYDREINDYDEVLASYYIRNSQPDKAYCLTNNELTKVRALFDMDRNDEGYELLMSVKVKYHREKTFYSLLAQYYFQKEMYDEAFKQINEFSIYDKNSPLIYQMRALIYEKQNDLYNEHLNWGKFNVVKGNRDVALNEYLTAYRFNDSDSNLVEAIAVLLESDGDKTKASEFYEKLYDLEPNNSNALKKLAEFRESIGDYSGAFEYIEKLKQVDPRSQFVLDNYESYKEKYENGGGLIAFLKSIFKRG